MVKSKDLKILSCYVRGDKELVVDMSGNLPDYMLLRLAKKILTYVSAENLDANLFQQLKELEKKAVKSDIDSNKVALN